MALWPSIFGIFRATSRHADWLFLGKLKLNDYKYSKIKKEGIIINKYLQTISSIKIMILAVRIEANIFLNHEIQVS